MPDGKYGRLFTEEDVRRLISATMGIIGLALLSGGPPITSDAMFERALAVTEPSHLQFPPDEPLFLLRGQDLAATAVFRPYAGECEEVGASAEHLDQVWKRYDEFMEFVHANRERVKVPD